MGFTKSKIIFCVGVIFLGNDMQSQQTPLPSNTIFNFDITKKQHEVSFLEDDYYTDADSFYDAICDRSAALPVSFYNRIVTRLYIFWCTHSLRMKYFVKKRYILLKKKTFTFFTTVSKRIKNLRSIIL